MHLEAAKQIFKPEVFNIIAIPFLDILADGGIPQETNSGSLGILSTCGVGIGIIGSIIHAGFVGTKLYDKWDGGEGIGCLTGLLGFCVGFGTTAILGITMSWTCPSAGFLIMGTAAYVFYNKSKG